MKNIWGEILLVNKCALTFASRGRGLQFWLDWCRGCNWPSDARQTRVNMCVPSSSVPCTTHPHTRTAPKAPAHALSTICRWGHKEQGQLLDPRKCWSLSALVIRETCRVLHIRFRAEAASWTMLLHEISNTGAKIHSQKASSTLPSAYSCRSWVPRGKSTLFDRKRVFSHSLKHHSETVFLRFLSMMKVIGTHCTICNYQMSLFRIFPMFPFPCCSLWLTHGVLREYPAYTYCFAFIFFSLSCCIPEIALLFGDLEKSGSMKVF